MKPAAIIFDWDNTLVDTWPVIHAALNATFAKFGQNLWKIEETRSRVKKSMRDSFPEIFGPDWQQAADFYQAQYRARHLTELKALPGAQTMLQAIQQEGIPMLIVSNKKGGNLRQEVAHFGWQDYFTRVIGADDAARDKPHADPVELAIKDTEYTLGPNVWFIGDSDVDLECAKNTGCRAILFGPHARNDASYSATHYVGQPYHLHALDYDQLLTALFSKSPLRPVAIS